MAIIDRLFGFRCATCGRRTRRCTWEGDRCLACRTAEEEAAAEQRRLDVEATEAYHRQQAWELQLARDEYQRRVEAEAAALANPTREGLQPVIDRYIARLDDCSVETPRSRGHALFGDSGPVEPVDTLRRLLDDAAHCFSFEQLLALSHHGDVWCTRFYPAAGGGVVSYDGQTGTVRLSLDDLRQRARRAMLGGPSSCTEPPAGRPQP